MKLSTIKTAVFSAVLSVLSVSAFAQAEGFMKYDESKFMMAQKMGKTIVLDFYKKGCPTCKAQKPTLEKAVMIFPNAEFMSVNYKKDKMAVKKHNVVSQSTILVFKGMEEVSRTTGKTKDVDLLKEIAKGL